MAVVSASILHHRFPAHPPRKTVKHTLHFISFLICNDRCHAYTQHARWACWGVLYRQQFTINGVKSYNSNVFRGAAVCRWYCCCCCYFKRAISRRNLIGKITIKYETSETCIFLLGGMGRRKAASLCKQSKNKCRRGRWALEKYPQVTRTREKCATAANVVVEHM